MEWECPPCFIMCSFCIPTILFNTYIDESSISVPGVSNELSCALTLGYVVK